MSPSAALLFGLSLAATAVSMRMLEERPRSRGQFSSECKPYPGRRVVMVTVNKEFVDFFMNWFYYAKPHLTRTEHLAVFAQDSKVVPILANYLPRTGIHFSIFEPPPGNISFALGPPHTILGNASNQILSQPPWGTKRYIEIVWRRPHYMLQLLQEGCTVLYADIDAVWQKDPFLDLGNRPGYDMHLVSDHRSGQCLRYVCSCFMYVQPTKETKQIMEEWCLLETSATAQKGNQPALTKVLNSSKALPNMTCLPKSKFPVGYDTDDFPDRTIAHANWMVGYEYKRCFLAKHGLWSQKQVREDCTYQYVVAKKHKHESGAAVAPATTAAPLPWWSR